MRLLTQLGLTLTLGSTVGLSLTFVTTLSVALIFGPAPASAAPLTVNFKDAIQLTLKNNFDIKMSESSTQEKEATRDKALGEFDLNLTTSYTLDHSETPSSSSLDGVASAIISDSKIQKAELRKKFGFLGTDISLPYNYTPSTSNSSYSRIAEGHNTSLGLNITQPLLRPFFWGYYERSLEKATFDYKLAREKHGEQLERVVQKTIELYLGTIRDFETFKVRESSFELASDLFQAAKEKEKLGRASLIDRIEAEGKMQKSKDAMIMAKGVYEDTRQALAQQIFSDTVIEIEVKNDMAELEVPPQELKLESQIQIALQNRPELKSAQISNESAELDLKSATADRLPVLNFEGKQTNKGLANNFQDSQEQVNKGLYVSRSSGVRLEMPLLQTAARGEYRIKTLKREQEELRRKNLIRNIQLDVTKSLRQIQINWQRIQALQRALEAETEKTKGQTQSFKHGRLSIFELNQSLQDRESAQLELLKARVNYIRSRFDLAKSRGQLLEQVAH